MLTRKLNRKMIEALIDAGALDEFHANRQSLRLSLEEAISYGDLVRIEIGGQVRIDLGLVSKPVMVMAKEDPIERAEREREALGFYLCSHPILQVKKKVQIQTEPLVRVAGERRLYRRLRVSAAGYVSTARKRRFNGFCGRCG